MKYVFVKKVSFEVEDSHRSTNYGDGIAALDSTWGDGSLFEDEELEALRRATAEALAVQLKLQPGQAPIHLFHF